MNGNMNIGFFKTKRSDFYISHGKGLSAEQIVELQQLKVGDRLKLWVNEDRERSPKLTLGKMIEKERSL